VNNKEGRIGACLRDYTLCFWEIEDGFKFQKVIKSSLPNLQIKIWSIEQAGKWITTDKQNYLHVWELEKEEPTTLERLHKEKIMEVIEIAKINAFVVSSLDKKLIVWDIKTLECRFEIGISKSFSIHTIRFSSQHDVSFMLSNPYS
jgi:WD40 repeat protein